MKNTASPNLDLEKLIRKTLRRASRETRITAFHEAAHAVVAHTLGLPVVKVFIERKDNYAGMCVTKFPKSIERIRDEYIPMSLAGEAVEMGRFKVSCFEARDACESDYEHIEEELIPRLWASTHSEPWEGFTGRCLAFYWDEIERAQKIARRVLRRQGVALRQLAALLVATSYVDGVELVNILDQYEHELFLANHLCQHLQAASPAAG